LSVTLGTLGLHQTSYRSDGPLELVLVTSISTVFFAPGGLLHDIQDCFTRK